MFTSRFANSVAGTAFAMGTLGLAALTTAGPAYALTTLDTQYLDALHKAGISFADPENQVMIGHRICLQELGHGLSNSQIAQEILAANPGLDQQAANIIAVDSVQAYCPNYS